MKTKLILFIVLILGTQNLLARNQSRQYLRNKLKRVSAKLQRSINNNIDMMGPNEIRKVITLSQQAINITQDSHNNFPPLHRSHRIKVSLEDQSFIIEAANIFQIKKKCIAKVEGLRMYSSVDEFSVTVNGRNKIEKRISGWLRDPRKQCQQVVFLALESGSAQGIRFSQKKYILSGTVGSFNNISFIATGNTIDQLEKSCEKNLSFSSPVTEMKIKLNNQKEVKLSAHGWWRNPKNLCSTAVAEVL